MNRSPPRSTRTDPRLPATTLVRSVLVSEWHPEAGGERRLAAEPAERREETEHLGVGEGVVLRQHRQLAVALLVVDVLAEAGHPLGAVGVEEIGRAHV